MATAVRAFKVTSLSKVDTTYYKEGDLFLTSRTIGFLHNGKIKTFIFKQADLSDYIKKEEVKELIQKEVEKNV